jgi:hypothetical protein
MATLSSPLERALLGADGDFMKNVLAELLAGAISWGECIFLPQALRIIHTIALTRYPFCHTILCSINNEVSIQVLLQHLLSLSNAPIVVARRSHQRG